MRVDFSGAAAAGHAVQTLDGARRLMTRLACAAVPASPSDDGRWLAKRTLLAWLLTDSLEAEGGLVYRLEETTNLAPLGSRVACVEWSALAASLELYPAQARAVARLLCRLCHHAMLLAG